MPPEALDELEAKLDPAARFVVATLRDENAQQRKQLDANIEQIRVLADQIAIWTEQVADLTRRLFGNRSEKLPTVKEELRRRVDPDAYSGRTWALIPDALGRLFRWDLGTGSGTPGH